MHHFITQISLNLAKMRTKKMVRHSKRHSRKKGGKSGKRSRGRRQYGGMWKIMTGWTSLITADANIDLKTGEKGIDIKYKGSPPDRRWLIGNGETFYKLHNSSQGQHKPSPGAPGSPGRYVDIMFEISGMRMKLDKPSDYSHKQVELTDEEFCHVFIKGPLAARYPYISDRLKEIGLYNSVCSIPPAHMLAAQRPSRAYRASHESSVSGGIEMHQRP